MVGGERGGVLMVLLTRRRPDAPEGFAEARLDRCQAFAGRGPTKLRLDGVREGKTLDVDIRETLSNQNQNEGDDCTIHHGKT